MRLEIGIAVYVVGIIRALHLYSCFCKLVNGVSYGVTTIVCTYCVL